jgi:GxxExxY protein
MKHGDTEGTEGSDYSLTSGVIGAAIEVHRALGPGLLESAYLRCLCRELQLRGVTFKTQLPVPVVYKGIRLECGYRLDLLVANTLVVEVKAIEAVPNVAYAQLLTYLRLTGLRIGLLINFNTVALRKGVKRIVNG